MKRPELSRRDFNRLAVTAFGGVVAGTAVGCGSGEKKKATPAKLPPGQKMGTVGMSQAEKEGKTETADAGDVPHTDNACAGLNACKDLGKGEHECAGQSACATVEKHSCHGDNTCKNLGGCEDTAGANACKGMGKCGVPMKRDGDAWKNARKAFEERMKAADTKFGMPPAAA